MVQQSDAIKINPVFLQRHGSLDRIIDSEF